MHSWIVTPAERPRCSRLRHGFAGLVLISLGVAFALIPTVSFTSFRSVIPVLIALSGLLHIIMARHFQAVLKGCLSLVFAGWLYLCLEQLWGLSFHNSWPVILILLGVRMGFRGLKHSHHRQGEKE